MSKKTVGAQKLAVLIDAENAQASLTPHLLAEIAKYGVANVKGIYGDWTGPLCLTTPRNRRSDIPIY